MTAACIPAPPRTKLPVVIVATVKGVLIGLLAANVWPILIALIGMPIGAIAEAFFLAAYFWWAGGGGPPSATKVARAAAFRRGSLTRAQWLWGLFAAISFAVAIHALLVVLFRIVPFPVAAFHEFSFPAARRIEPWLAIATAAISAAICEETGFRGYMQQPIEKRHGAFIAVLLSSALFTVVHLSHSWAIPGMVPIVFVAGVLLGLIAWASGSLVPGMIGHTLMDIGLFGYWWSGFAGTFSAKTIGLTGIDGPFVIATALASAALLLTLIAIVRLRRLRRSR